METRRSYGLSSNLFVAPKTSSQSLVFGGIGEDTARWTRVLSHRAAHLLWFHLTSHLYPDKSVRVTAAAQTMPARSLNMPMITHHINLRRTAEGLFEVAGMVGDATWAMRMTIHEAYRLWDALDLALHPRGWQTAALAADE